MPDGTLDPATTIPQLTLTSPNDPAVTFPVDMSFGHATQFGIDFAVTNLTQDGYRPVSRDADLQLDGDALRLAVTETVTAPRRIQHKLARDQAWKLGFVALRNALQGEAIRPFKPVPTAWQGGSFADYCRLLAGREGLALPDEVDWARWEAAGEQRRGEVRRLELVRHGFRRALEVWLVMDLALGLEEAGFEVEVGTFCDRALTPRNLMVLAERRSG